MFYKGFLEKVRREALRREADWNYCERERECKITELRLVRSLGIATEYDYGQVNLCASVTLQN